ncbi:MAG: cell division topological specificity factor MinE [Candidatus Eremiobacteraeota bacterium]|nr:cell division topological specificity factor MinE [Candidatus Eremiobacteraeota bacterium]MBV8722161.1 cell division topological specificity factor MinE [Candidatus Eremiobacteraeota bacterium]
MIDFLKRLFGQTGSSATAKERLRLVLMTDHLELAPDMIDAMKRDLVDVISRYVEVDRDRIEVNFEQQDRALAMLANIPILSVNRPPVNRAGNGNGNGHGRAAEPAQAAAVAAAPNVSSPGAQAATDSIVTRRRRRRKKNQSIPAGAKPAPAH